MFCRRSALACPRNTRSLVKFLFLEHPSHGFPASLSLRCWTEPSGFAAEPHVFCPLSCHIPPTCTRTLVAWLQWGITIAVGGICKGEGVSAFQALWWDVMDSKHMTSLQKAYKVQFTVCRWRALIIASPDWVTVSLQVGSKSLTYPIPQDMELTGTSMVSAVRGDSWTSSKKGIENISDNSGFMTAMLHIGIDRILQAHHHPATNKTGGYSLTPWKRSECLPQPPHCTTSSLS